jgi:hypothetical protein
LLKIGELRDLKAIEPHFPPKAPCPKRRRFPIVFHESEIVLGDVDTDGLKAFDINRLDLCGFRLKDHLILVIARGP